MPSGVIPDEGLSRGLRWVLRNADTELDAWRVLLFVNDYTPGPTTTLADLVEPSWSTYLRVALPESGWSDPVVVDHVAVSTWGTDPIEFENASSATETVYGCALYDPVNNVLVFAQRFDVGDIRPVAAGESFFVIPRMTRRGLCP